MKAALLTLCAIAATALVGCGGPDPGTPPPPTKPVTEQDLNNMPPQAATQVRSMQKYGATQQSAMEAAVAAQKRAGH